MRKGGARGEEKDQKKGSESVVPETSKTFGSGAFLNGSLILSYSIQ
jgi:hypothetical protein